MDQYPIRFVRRAPFLTSRFLDEAGEQVTEAVEETEAVEDQATEPTEEERETTERKEREKLLGEAYTAATRTIRDKYRNEFNQQMKTEAKSRGIDWQPKLTPEQQAEQQLREILAAFPQLREKLAETAS